MLINSIKLGFKKGINTTIMLAKIIVPIYFIITIIKYTFIMELIAHIFEPLMGIFNLPGEAVIPFITGIFLDEYGAIAGINAISLNAWEITIVAILVSFAHSLFIETAIIKKLGLSISFFSVSRIVLAIIFGCIIGNIGGIFL